MPVPSVLDTDNGCYLKVGFPKEIRLPDPNIQSIALDFSSISDNMMSNANGANTLTVDTDVFNQS